jgi:RNA polymerase sigma-70 factor (TIGR02960 family)
MTPHGVGRWRRVATSSEPDDGLARAIAGDEVAFAAIVQPHERSLFRHCYRMLGSGMDAEDAVQDTLLRAWRRLDAYDGRGAFGGWLYRIATNICLDRLRATRGRVDAVSHGPATAPDTALSAPDPELVWVEPVDDVRLGLGAVGDPQDEVVGREDVSLAFVAALQRLAPRQRACLLLHDVLGFSQPEVSAALEISPTAVNSLLFRARDAAQPRGDSRGDPADPMMKDLLDRYVRAWELADIDAFVELVADDIRLSMPPMTEWYDGRADVAAFLEWAVFSAVRPHGVPLRVTWCNGQPAFATYEPGPGGVLVAGGLQVLTVEDRDNRLVITDIVSYRDPMLVGACGLPDRSAECPGGRDGRQCAYARAMRGEATIHIDAPPEKCWDLVSDVTNTSRISAETFDAEWLEGSSGPAVGAKFRGHVKRNGRGPTYWTKCTVVACELGREFTFVLGNNPDKAMMTWGYKFAPSDGGTDVTESYAMADNFGTRMYSKVFGKARGRTNAENMRKTLERLKAAAEAP